MAEGVAYRLATADRQTLGWLQGPGDNFSVQDNGLRRASTELKFSNVQLRSRADIAAELAAGGAPQRDIDDILVLRDVLANSSKAVSLTPQQGDIDEPLG